MIIFVKEEKIYVFTNNINNENNILENINDGTKTKTIWIISIKFNYKQKI